MTRTRWISWVGGLGIAIGLWIAFAYLAGDFNMSHWWWDRSGLLWSSLGFVVAGAVVVALARVKSGNWMLAMIPAVLLGVAYTLGRPLGPGGRPIWDWLDNGFDLVTPVVVGALVAVALWLIWKAGADHSDYAPRPGRTRSALLLVGGALLALVFLVTFDRLQRAYFSNTNLEEFAYARWQVSGLVILGGVFAGVFLVTRRAPLLHLGALVMLSLMFLAYPRVFGATSEWASRLFVLAEDAEASPAIPLAVGVLLGILASRPGRDPSS